MLLSSSWTQPHVDMTVFYEEFLSTIPSRWIADGCGMWFGPRRERISQSWLPRCCIRRIARDRETSGATYQTSGLRPYIFLRLRRKQAMTAFGRVRVCYTFPKLISPTHSSRLWRSLKPDGVMYVSFKLGNGERRRRQPSFHRREPNHVCAHGFTGSAMLNRSIAGRQPISVLGAASSG
jgi:hypothetical protein